MTSSTVSLFRAGDPYETLIANMMVIEREPQYRIKDARTEQLRLKGVMSDANSTLSALHTLLKRFTDTLSNPFESRTASLASDITGFAVTAGDTAAFGTHSLKVERLATSDARLSKQYTADAASDAALNARQTFTIKVATSLDASGYADVVVDFTPSASTNKELLDQTADAIQAAMDDAVAAGTIKSTEVASASVVNETSSTARLSLRSGTTGFAGRLEITNTSGSLLSDLDILNAAVVTGTAGGMVTDVGSSETDSLLNAKFLLDGLTLYRSKNEVTDALTGVTLSLKQVMTDPADFTVTPDSSKVKTEITDFIKKYNDILSFIKGKSVIDKDAGTRGDLANDSAFTGLRYNMRSDMVKAVSGQPAGAPASITDLGITIENDGTLTLKDESKLLAAVKDNASAVKTLFSGADGLATRLKTRLDQFVGINGLIETRKDLIDEKVKNLDNQIKEWDVRLASRENQLRLQFAQLQSVAASVQGQQMYLGNFFQY